jgi:hypothetical protein
MIVAGDAPTLRTWHLLQHEGFHQYARAALGRKLPPSLDEGLAEYFGEAIFTGDGYVTGVIPSWRLQRLRQAQATESLEALPRFLKLTAEQWNADAAVTRYDQAWSIVQFLLHGDDGRWEPALTRYLRALSSGREAERAWADCFGSPEELQQHWQEYWKSQPTQPNRSLYAQAATLTVTSFLARATAQGQSFDSFPAFRQAADELRLQIAEKEWLPPRLLSESIDLGQAMGAWELYRDPSGAPKVLWYSSLGPGFVGSFTLHAGGVEHVSAKAVAQAWGTPASNPAPK